MAGFLGKGEVYIDKNLKGDWRLLGNVIRFAIDETDAEVKERISRQKDTYGQALDRVIIPKPTKISIEFDDLNLTNLDLALRGDIVDVPSNTGSVIDEEVTAKLGVFKKLAHSGLSNVVVKNSEGTTTYEEGTDYEVRPGLGLITPLEGGNITDGELLKVSYDYNEPKQKIFGSKQASIKAALLFDGVNQVNGKACRIYIYQAVLQPKNAVDFLADDFVTVTLEGTLITPEGQDKPYYIEYEE